MYNSGNNGCALVCTFITIRRRRYQGVSPPLSGNPECKNVLKMSSLFIRMYQNQCKFLKFPGGHATRTPYNGFVPSALFGLPYFLIQVTPCFLKVYDGHIHVFESLEYPVIVNNLLVPERFVI